MTQHSQNGEGVQPCPFCGSQQITTAPDMRIGRPWWAVICKACGISNTRENEAEAITAWNTRQSLTAREPATADVGREDQGEMTLAQVIAEAKRVGLLMANCGEVNSTEMQHWRDTITWLSALSRAAPSSGHAMAEGMDGRCGFNGGTGLDAPKSPEWLAACEKLALQYDRWKMKDKAAQIRSGHPGWLIEQACVEAVMAATTPPTTNDAIPAAWKLVPVEMTDEMARTASVSWLHTRPNKCLSRERAFWSAALSAAPSAPATSDSLPGRGELQWRTDMDAAKHGKPVVLNSDSPLWQYPFVGFWNAATGWWDFSDPNLSGCFAVSELVNQWAPLPDALAPAEAIRDGGEGGETA